MKNFDNLVIQLMEDTSWEDLKAEYAAYKKDVDQPMSFVTWLAARRGHIDSPSSFPRFLRPVNRLAAKIGLPHLPEEL